MTLTPDQIGSAIATGEAAPRMGVVTYDVLYRAWYVECYCPTRDKWESLDPDFDALTFAQIVADVDQTKGY